MSIGCDASNVAQDGVAIYKKIRGIQERENEIIEARGETVFINLCVLFTVVIATGVPFILYNLWLEVDTEYGRWMFIFFAIFGMIELPAIIYAILYYTTWQLSRVGDKIILKKFWWRWEISLPEMKAAVSNGKKVKRTARYYCLPMGDKYCKINISQTYGAVQIVEDALRECGIEPLPKIRENS